MYKYRKVCAALIVILGLNSQVTLCASPVSGMTGDYPAGTWENGAGSCVMQLQEGETDPSQGQQTEVPGVPQQPDSGNDQQDQTTEQSPSGDPQIPQQPQEQPPSTTGGEALDPTSGNTSGTSKSQTTTSNKKKNQTTKKNTTKVSKVTELTALQLTSTKIKLSWKKAKNANGYYVYSRTEGGKYKLVKNTKQKYYTVPVSVGKKYFFKVVAYNKNKYGTVKAKKATVSYNNKEIVDNSHQKYTYSEMEKDIMDLCSRFKGRVSYSVIGKSVRGRNIYDVILGNPNAKKSVLVVSAIHAREYVTTVTLMKQLEYYLMNYYGKVDGSKPSEVFSKCCVHYVMMANPDGVTISQNSMSTWKANANGVNLNLNFSYNFDISGSTGDGSFTGVVSGSEPETRAIMEITDKLRKRGKLIVVNYHAMGNIVFGSYSGKDGNTGNMIRKMYQTARQTTGYGDASGYSGKSNGNYREYLSYVVNVPSITIEVGSTPCPLPSSSYRGIYERNKYVLIREARLLL